ncbi:hypothetical protein [Mycobacterium sp. NAZ190054]|uniref:hypothetical protein n=1 Tax=Mycobacterium sp. NAZ190054 TaxID=1747766 RepID=UPI00079603C7|nr:hypothetical protein [Mycobacterium sp. NAZ190054]KWX66952.1 hypothetical protein ASJ79_05290 [Mycobacterium sp. NAZ190054]
MKLGIATPAVTNVAGAALRWDQDAGAGTLKEEFDPIAAPEANRRTLGATAAAGTTTVSARAPSEQIHAPAELYDPEGQR